MSCSGSDRGGVPSLPRLPADRPRRRVRSGFDDPEGRGHVPLSVGFVPICENEHGPEDRSEDLDQVTVSRDLPDAPMHSQVVSSPLLRSFGLHSLEQRDSVQGQARRHSFLPSLHPVRSSAAAIMTTSENSTSEISSWSLMPLLHAQMASKSSHANDWLASCLHSMVARPRLEAMNHV